MDFKAAFNQGIAIAQDLASQRISIRRVLEKFISDIYEASGGKVIISFMISDFVPVNRLDDYLGEFVHTEEQQVRLYMCARPSGVQAGAQRLAVLEYSAVNGYPCFLEFGDERFVVKDQDELGQALDLMLHSAVISQKLFNALSAAE